LAYFIYKLRITLTDLTVYNFIVNLLGIICTVMNIATMDLVFFFYFHIYF
jgi:hypothetical protein